VAKINKFLIKDHRPDEKVNHELRLLRKKIFPGGAALLGFVLLAMLFFDGHQALMDLTSLVFLGGWFILALLVFRYMSIFFKGKSK
jgi:polyferredoxin